MGKIARWFSAGSGAGTLVSVQWLRFLAALLVVLSHVGLATEDGLGERGETGSFVWFDGHFGVCVFFVISGFIMLHISSERFGQDGAVRAFARNRIIRIVPLYWLVTTAQLAILFAGSQTGRSRDVPGWLDILQSYLFIPFLNDSGRHRPVLGVGWTLNFEMFFYALFCLALLLPRRIGLPVLMAAMCGFALWPWPIGSTALEILSDPIILYFVVGMALALVRERCLRRGPLPVVPMVLPLCAVGVVVFTVLDGVFAAPVWGPLFAVGLVGLAVLTRDADTGPVRREIASSLGALSYSLYLSHPLVLAMGLLVWLRLAPGVPAEVFYGVATLIALVGGALCWRLVERPVAAWLRRS